MGVNIIIFSDISNEYFEVIDLEDAAVTNLATFAGGLFDPFRAWINRQLCNGKFSIVL